MSGHLIRRITKAEDGKTDVYGPYEPCQICGPLDCMSVQYPVGHEIRIERDPIIMRRINDCEHCGAELWTYNGRGRHRRVGDLGGHPVLTLHTWLMDCPGATTSATASPKDTR